VAAEDVELVLEPFDAFVPGADCHAERECDDEDAGDSRAPSLLDRGGGVGHDAEPHERDVENGRVGDRREAMDYLVVVEPVPVEVERRPPGDQGHSDRQSEVEPARQVDDPRDQKNGRGRGQRSGIRASFGCEHDGRGDEREAEHVERVRTNQVQSP
jgi:hypothetical protein